MRSGRSEKLTNRTVAALAPGLERYVVWDSELRGFACRVEPSGTKSFLVRYRPGGGRSAPKRFYTIGRFPIFSPEDARREARRLLGAVATGQDPAGERNAARSDMSVAELCDLYMREAPNLPTKFGQPKGAETLSTDQGRIDNHIKPLLGKKRVGDIVAADIQRFMRDIAAGKTAKDNKTGPRKRLIVKGGRGAATRVTGLLSGIFSFAVAEGIRAENPVKGVQRYADGKSDRALSLQEITKLGFVLRRMAEQGVNPSAINIIKLLIVTGARRNEIAGLRWGEVDFERSVIRLPAHRHKTGSQKGAKYIPLTDPARTILSELSEDRTSDFVFPATSGDSHFQGIKRVWQKARAQAGLNDVRLHDLRHTFASTGVSSGDGLPIIGALLGHSNARTTQRYAHIANDPLQKAAGRIAKNLADALEPTGTSEEH